VGPERGGEALVAGQDDLPGAALLGEAGERVRHRLEVLIAMDVGVALVSGLGELRPAAAAVMPRHLAPEIDFLAQAAGNERDQARVVAVDEDDQGRRRRLEERRQGREVCRRAHHEGVLHRDPDGQRLPEAEGVAREERDPDGLREDPLVDQGGALRLDPAEVARQARIGRGAPRLPELVRQEKADPVALVLVRPPDAQVHAHHRAGRPGDPGQLAQSRRHVDRRVVGHALPRAVALDDWRTARTSLARDVPTRDPAYRLSACRDPWLQDPPMIFSRAPRGRPRASARVARHRPR
jgi:hypothetical protein